MDLYSNSSSSSSSNNSSSSSNNNSSNSSRRRLSRRSGIICRRQRRGGAGRLLTQRRRRRRHRSKTNRNCPFRRLKMSPPPSTNRDKRIAIHRQPWRRRRDASSSRTSDPLRFGRNSPKLHPPSVVTYLQPNLIIRYFYISIPIAIIVSPG